MKRHDHRQGSPSRALLALLLAVAAGLIVSLVFVTASVFELTVQAAVIWVSVGGLALLLLLTVLTCLAVAAVLPPLKPLAEVSVLGQRFSRFTRFSLSVAALFGTAYITWVMTTALNAGTTAGSLSTDPALQAFHLMGALIFVAAWAYLVLLSGDLVRAGRRRRRNAADYVVRELAQRWHLEPKVLRPPVRAAVASPLWMLFSLTFVAPMVLATVTTLFQRFGVLFFLG